MAEIRANCKYQLKGFHFSGEFEKNPPNNAKSWTFRDSRPNERINNRPEPRKWDDNVTGQIKWPGDTNTPQQYVKGFETPESQLRAEFFNAYKKYYRRVDIKRLELESTLNVDAKYKTAAETVEGESSLYKEKECMEINIILDTEQDDALVSGKVRRTAISAPYGEVIKQHSDEVGINGYNHNEKTTRIFGNGKKKAVKVGGLIDEAENNNVIQSNQSLPLNVFPQASQEYYMNSLELSKEFEKKYPIKGNQPMMKQKQEQPPLRSIFSVRSETPQTNENLESEIASKKSALGTDRIESTDRPVNRHRSLTNQRNGHVIDLTEDSSDSSEGFEISENKCAEVWGPSLASLENECKRTGGYQRPTASKAENQRYVRTRPNMAGTLNHNSEIQPNSNLPSCSQSEEPYCVRPRAKKFFRTDIFKKPIKNVKRSEFSVKSNCEEEELSQPTKGKTKQKSFCRNYVDTKIKSNNHNLSPSPDSRCSYSHNGLRSGFEEVRGIEKSQSQYKYSRDSVQREKFVGEQFHKRVNTVGSAEECWGCQATEELESDNKIRQQSKICSDSLTIIRFRGLRGEPFKGPNKNLLKSIVRTVIKSYPDNKENEEIVENNCYVKDQQRANNGKGNKESYSIKNCESDGMFRKSRNTRTTFSPKTNESLCSFETRNNDYYEDGPSFEKCQVNEMFPNVTGFYETSEVSTKCLESQTHVATKMEEEVSGRIKPIIILRKNGIPDKITEASSDYNTCSPLQSSSDYYSFCEVSDGSKNVTPQSIHNNSASPEIFETSYLGEDYAKEVNIPHSTKSRINEKETRQCGTEVQSTGAHRYSNISSEFRRHKEDEKQCKTVVPPKQSYNYESSKATKSFSRIAEDSLQESSEKDLQFSKEEREHSQQRWGNILKLNAGSDIRSNPKSIQVVSEEQRKNLQSENDSDENFEELSNGRKMKFGENGQPNDSMVEKNEFRFHIPKEDANIYAENGNQLFYDSRQAGERRSQYSKKNLVLCKTSSMTNPKVYSSNQGLVEKDFPKINPCNKKIPKLLNTDSLQIGPTYSLNYTPEENVVSKIERTKKHDNNCCFQEDADRCTCGRSLHDLNRCRNENVVDFLHKSGSHVCPPQCGVCCSVHSSNSVICLYKEQVPTDIEHKRRSGMNLFDFHNGGGGDYKEPHWRPGHYQTRNGNNCHKSDWDSRYQCGPGCSMMPRQRECNVSLYPEESKMFCGCHSFYDRKFQDDEQRINLEEANYNRLYPIGPSYKNEQHCAVAVQRRNGFGHFNNSTNENFCFSHSDNNNQVTSSALKFDNERRWAASGHQPTRSVSSSRSRGCGDNISANTNTLLCRESTTSQQANVTNGKVMSAIIKESKNNCFEYNTSYQGKEEYLHDEKRSEYSIHDEDNRKPNSVKNGRGKSFSSQERICSGSDVERSDDNSTINNDKTIFHATNDVIKPNLPCEKNQFINKTTSRREVFPSNEKNKAVFIRTAESPTYLSKERALGNGDEQTRGNKRYLKKKKGGFASNRSFSEHNQFNIKEEWECDRAQPARRNFGLSEEEEEEQNEEEKSEFCFVPNNDPIYLKEEQWKSDDHEEQERMDPSRNQYRNLCRLPLHEVSDPNYHCRESKFSDVQRSRRKANFSRKEERRDDSSVHGVGEEQWASDEGKYEDYRKETLPKNRTNCRKKHYRRAFNPKRWDMVTDLPKNEYARRQYLLNEMEDTSSYGCSNLGTTLIFNNKSYNADH